MRADNQVRWVSRRAMLCGASAMVALPAMRSLMPRDTWAQEVVHPKRFLAWFFPNGVPNINDWRPAATGANWQTSMLLSGLDPVKEHVSVLSNLRNEGAGPDHTHGTGAFLTGRIYPNESVFNLGGPSIDQVIANGLQANGTGGPIHSLQLGIPDNISEPGIASGGCNNISYNGSGGAIAKQTNAGDAFDSIFSGFDNTDDSAAAEEAARRRALRLSVLDTVTGDANRLMPALSSSDRLRLQEYLDSVRSVEVKIGNIAEVDALSCEPPGSLMWPGQLDARIDAFADLMALAFECDLTRVITFMAASGATGLSRDFPNYHLSITHEQDGDWERKHRETVVWEVEKFARLVDRLSTKMESDGVTPIIDNSALFFSSDISDGNNHNHNNMPVLLAGGLGGAITKGFHRDMDNAYFADVYQYVADSMGVTVDGFGLNGQGRVTSL